MAVIGSFFHSCYDFDSKRLKSEFHHCAPFPRIEIKCSEMNHTADWLEGAQPFSFFSRGHQSSLFVLVNTVPFPQRSPNNSVCILNSPMSLHVFFIASIWLPPAAPSPHKAKPVYCSRASAVIKMEHALGARHATLPVLQH